MNNKKEYSQFYSTNTEELFQKIINLFLKEFNTINKINQNIPIIEPCCGQGDLIKFLKSKGLNNFELYDIDPKYENTIKQDTIINNLIIIIK